MISPALLVPDDSKRPPAFSLSDISGDLSHPYFLKRLNDRGATVKNKNRQAASLLRAHAHFELPLPNFLAINTCHDATQDRITALPEEFMLVARSSLLIRGVARRLHAPVSCAELWKQDAQDFLVFHELWKYYAESGAPIR